MEAGAGVVDIADDRLVQDVALGRLDAHRADQHEPVEIARRQRRHLGRDPAAEAEPDKAGALDPEIGEQPLIKRGDVARMAHPVRPLLDAKPGMARHDHVEFPSQRVVERQIVERPDIVVQHQHRTAAAAAQEPQLDVAQFEVLFAPPRHRPHPLL